MDLRDRLSAWFRDLHAHPETAREEFRTTEFIRKVLSENGIRMLDTGLPTGVIAVIGSGKPVIALRGDMDALPVKEDSGLPYASGTDGKMHACGHDFHTVAVLGAALLLKQREKDLRGTVKILFQPGEEVHYGALAFLGTGLLEDVEEYYGIHTHPDYEAGTLGIREGPVMAAPDYFSLKITGQSAHGAQPHLGADPVPAMAAFITAVQTLVSRRTDALSSCVISISHVEAGRTWNVIPDSAFLEGTARTMTPEERDDTERGLRDMAEGICRAHGCGAEFVFTRRGVPLANTEELCDFARKVAEKQGLRVVRQLPQMIGEDFAEYLVRRPGCFIRVGTGGGYPLHHPHFTADPEALPGTAAFLAELAMERTSFLQGKERE